MKLKIRLISVIILTIILSNNCIHFLEEDSEIVTINASISTDTRVSYNDVTLKLNWELNDQLLLVGYNNNTYIGNSIFTWTGINNSFSGELVNGATIYKAYYLIDGLNVDQYGNIIIASDFWDQTQNGNNTTSHLNDKLLLFDEDANTLDQTFQLVLKNTIIKFNLSNIPSDVGNITKLIWTVKSNVGGTNKVSVLNLENVNSNNGIFYLLINPNKVYISPNEITNIKLIGDKSYEWSFVVINGKEYEPGYRYTAIVSNNWIETQTFFQYTINANGLHEIWQKSSSICPANLTIDWGDGSSNTIIIQGTNLFNYVIASHSYNKGTYTVTIYSDQHDNTLKQIPQLLFYKYSNNSGSKDLISVITPFPNMETTDFSNCFNDCKYLITIPSSLFNNNPDIVNFNSTFNHCIKLQLNSDLFPNPEVYPNYFGNKIMNFSSCFNKVGEKSIIQGVAPRLWKFDNSNNWIIADCFKNANLINYGDIPQNWK